MVCEQAVLNVYIITLGATPGDRGCVPRLTFGHLSPCERGNQARGQRPAHT